MNPVNNNQTAPQIGQAGQSRQTGANPTAGGALAGDTAETGQFKEVWTKFMSEYGKKPEQAREIKKELNKDDYLRIMVTQMQHQDPTKPFDADKLASEMAQIGMIKHMQDVGQALNKMTEKDKPLERIAMTNLIGKQVTVDKTRFIHHKDTNDTLEFKLDRDAQQVAIAIVSQTGDVVKEENLGELKAGSNVFKWDGKKKNTLAADDGTYFFRVDAVDERGAPIQTNFVAEARVVGVSFEKGEPVLLVGDQNSQVKVGMNNIVKVVDTGALIPGAQLAGSAAQIQPVPALSGPAAQEAQAAQEMLSKVPAGLSPEEQAYSIKRRQEAQAQIESEKQLKQKDQAGQGQTQQTSQQRPLGNAQGFPHGLGEMNEANAAAQPVATAPSKGSIATAAARAATENGTGGKQ